jgi:FlaA1/EpsC-like NDP-sugar epimerase
MKELLINKLIDLPRWAKQISIILLEFLIFFLSTWIVFSIRLEEFHQINNVNLIFYLIPNILLSISFYFFGLYSSFFRYVDKFSVLLIIKIFIFYSIIYTSVLIYISIENEIIPRSLGLLHAIISCCFILSERTIISNLVLYSSSELDKVKNNQTNIIIYGVNNLSLKIIQFLNSNKNYSIIAIISEETNVKKISSHKISDNSNLEKILKNNRVDEIIVFTENLKNNSSLDQLLKYNIKIRKISSNYKFLESSTDIDISNLEIEDLINRSENQPIKHLILKNIQNKTVLVTGASGSIGNEISQQVINQNPKKVFFLDNNEYEIYLFKKKIQKYSNIDYEFVLGDISDEQFIKNFFKKNKIDTLFHAAAYKHVPLLEDNIYSSIKNNIVGTYNLCMHSQEAKVKNFVLISTDKAIRPTSIMGKSKRVTELIALNIKKCTEYLNNDCNFTVVRFGNVLGSRGSIVPLFKEQIKNGGPLTITDFRMKRYFMSIPEAAGLVIQSASLTDKDNIFLLDMGKEIKILDIAKKMIAINGMTERTIENPNGDLEIKEIGIRPGEKLSEELNFDGKFEKTLNPKIFRSLEKSTNIDVLNVIDNFEKLLKENNDHNLVMYLDELSSL